jgi:hypothetical protein
MKYGYDEGEVCGRKDCKGVIELRESDRSCSCHIHPPCSACTAEREWCPECGYERKDDFVMNGYLVNHKKTEEAFRCWEPRKLDNTKIDWRNEHHTHFTMKKVGVYPEGTSIEDVRKAVDGTFGGRFDHFGNGTFTFISYTD